MLRRALVALVLMGIAGPVWAQTPNAWTEHPNTTFSLWARASGVEAEHDLCNPSTGVGAILSAWVAGAYHEGMQKFLVYRGGGHADGCWNGGASFDPATKTWARVTTASPNATKMTSTDGGDTNFKVKYSDGTPSSVHSYGTQFCIVGGPLDGKCPTSGGIFWSHAGLSTPETPFIYDPTQPTAATAYTEKKLRPGGYGTSMAWNKTRQRALTATSGAVYEWDPVADVYTTLFSASGGGTGTTTVIDEAAGRVYLLMGSGGVTPGTRLKVIDYATAATTKYQTIATTGGAGIEDVAAPGFLFTGRDSQNRVRLVGLGKATVTIPPVPPSTTPTTAPRAAIFTLLDDGLCGRGTAAPCVWTRITPTNATSNLPPSPMTNGTWNKFFAYGCDLFAIVSTDTRSAATLPPSGDKGNVWSFRPDFALPSCGAPPPSTFAVTVAANPANGGTPTGPAQPVAGGATVTLTRPAATGFTFTGWSGDPVCADSFAMPSRAVACTANYARIQVSLTLTATGSTGAGTLSGAGTYDYGTTATIGATPQSGSAVGTVSGDAGCQVGPITMTGSKACNVPFVDVAPPVVTIQSPTAGQIVKQTVPVAVAMADNMPGGTVSLLLDGVAFTGTEINPASLTEGAHQLVAQAVDAAGNTAQAAVAFISVQCLCQAALTLQTDGDGTGTVAGAGKYLPGATVEITATPAADSQVTGYAPAPCDAHFLMPKSDLACTVTFAKKPYPLAVTMTGTGTGTVSGGGSYKPGTLVAVGGAPAAGSVEVGVSPAPCSRTPFPMPAAALTCVVTYNLVVPTFALTTAVVGQGTVTGAGTYAAGAAITLTAVPASGYMLSGFSPAPCAAAFTMPANALACTVTFVSTGNSPLPSLQPRSWLGVPLTGLGESKHARIAHDSKRKLMVVAGGDGTDGGGNSYTGQNVFTLNLATGSTFVKIHGTCPAPGGLAPPRPDNVTWAYDAKRDQGVIMPAYYGGGATPCPPAYSGAATGATTATTLVDAGLPQVPARYLGYMLGREIKFEGNVTVALKGKVTTITAFTAGATTLGFTAISATVNGVTTQIPPATGDRYVIAQDEPSPKMGWVFNFADNTWARGPWPSPAAGGTSTGWGGDLHDHFGVLDPVTDAVYRFVNLCGSGGVQIIPLDGSPSACVPFAFTGAPAGSWDPSNDQTAIDVQGRAIYVISRYKRTLTKWDIDQRKVVEMIPLPTTWVKPNSDFGGGDFETHLAFDSKNRVLMHTNDNGYGQGSTSTTHLGSMWAQTYNGTVSGATTVTSLVDAGLAAVWSPLVGRVVTFEGNVTAALAGKTTTVTAATPGQTTLTFGAVTAAPAVGDRYTIAAKNQGVYFFNVDTKVWEWEPAPSDRAVSGNVLGYDPANNAFIYVGRSTSTPNLYWLYRYR